MQYRLGSTDIHLSPIGLGCWQFSGGKGISGSFWSPLDRDTKAQILRESLDAGVNWFDTAEAYGRGAGEEALAAALASLDVDPDSVVIADKWMPVLRLAGSITRTFPKRTRLLNPYPIALHQVHQPASLSSIPRQMHRMADLVESGRIRAVGVSNFSSRQMQKAHEALRGRGLSLASNQVRFNLLDRDIESNGVLDVARELGITIIAYSPLAQGLLTGKYHDEPDRIRKRPGPRKLLRRFRRAGLEDSRPLIEELRRVAEEVFVSPTPAAAGTLDADRPHPTPAQISLAWIVRRHGEHVVAIPGASSPTQARENAGAMFVELSEAQLERLDAAARATAAG